MEKQSAEQHEALITRAKGKYPSRLAKKVISEMISSYLLVFVACGASALSRSGDEDLKISKLGASVASGLIVTVMIYSVGHISGAHMNPAVTLAFAAVRHFPWKQVPFYAIAQLSGAVCASLTLGVLLHPIDQIGITRPSGTELQSFIMELVATFCMMFVTSAVATDTKAIGELAGIAVGSAVCIASILAGPISGASMNPARTLGPAIMCNYYKGIWIYVLGPICGTLMGSWAYNFIRLSDKPAHPVKIRRSSNTSSSITQHLLLPNNNEDNAAV